VNDYDVKETRAYMLRGAKEKSEEKGNREERRNVRAEERRRD
jgi:hypothetical protein